MKMACRAEALDKGPGSASYRNNAYTVALSQLIGTAVFHWR